MKSEHCDTDLKCLIVDIIECRGYASLRSVKNHLKRNAGVDMPVSKLSNMLQSIKRDGNIVFNGAVWCVPGLFDSNERY